MPTTQIVAQYVNEPKSPKAPGNIKTADGRYFKVWKSSKVPGTATLGDFKANQTYEVEYTEEEPYNGRPSYMINKIVSASTSQSTNGNGHHDASAMYRNGNGNSSYEDGMKWGNSLKVASLLLAGAGADKVDVLMEVARFIYAQPAETIVDQAKKLFNATEAE